MSELTLHFGAFSPTGGTRRVMRMLVNALPRQAAARLDDFEFTLPEERSMRRFAPTDAVVLCVPVYYGRIPQLLAQSPLPFEGNGAKALAVVVYGNRAYEDALAEWRDRLSESGFDVTGGAAFIARHTHHERLAEGRPDDEDAAAAARCMEAFVQKLRSGDDARPAIPGGPAPYRPYGAPLPPPILLHHDRCHLCGNCADNCPAGIIDPLDFTVDEPERCMACRACIKRCPDGARHFSDDVRSALEAKMADIARNNAERKAPVWFF